MNTEKTTLHSEDDMSFSGVVSRLQHNTKKAIAELSTIADDIDLLNNQINHLNDELSRLLSRKGVLQKGIACINQHMKFELPISFLNKDKNETIIIDRSDNYNGVKPEFIFKRYKLQST